MSLYRVLHVVLAPPVRAVWGLEVDGAAHVPPGRVIVVANHDSLSDPFFLAAALERQLRFLAKRELWRIGLGGWALDRLGGIPVERRRGDVGAVAAAARALEQAAAVAIFPQGTVLGPPDRPWQRGAARLALTTGAPLLPVAIIGADAVLRPGTRLPRRAPVKVVIGSPIVVERTSPTIPATRELTERLREAVAALRAS